MQGNENEEFQDDGSFLGRLPIARTGRPDASQHMPWISATELRAFSGQTDSALIKG